MASLTKRALDAAKPREGSISCGVRARLDLAFGSTLRASAYSSSRYVSGAASSVIRLASSGRSPSNRPEPVPRRLSGMRQTASTPGFRSSKPVRD